EILDKAAAEEEKKRFEERVEESTHFLEENKGKQGVVTLPSGLQYKVLDPGNGKFHPTPSARVEVHYVGKLIDGTQFDSSVKTATEGPRLIQPATFAPEDVIPGWEEAMQLMVEGARWELFVPSHLAYGNAGSLPKIPGGSALIFDLEISKIKGGKVPKQGIEGVLGPV
ncbi:unnamed protein product, partial [Polarella glacialis]